MGEANGYKWMQRFLTLILCYNWEYLFFFVVRRP